MKKPFNPLEKALIWSLVFVVWLVLVIIGEAVLCSWLIATFSLDPYVVGLVAVVSGIIAVAVPTVIISENL